MVAMQRIETLLILSLTYKIIMNVLQLLKKLLVDAALLPVSDHLESKVKKGVMA